MANVRICSVDGCGKKRFGRSLCQMHYARLRTHGDVHGGKYHHGDQEKYLKEVVLNFIGDDCLVWPFERTRKGYGRIKTRGERFSAHRLVCAEVYGAPPSERHVAAHSCGNGHLGCVSPRHLRWATHKENHADKLIHGTVLRGERNHNASMTEATARRAKAMLGNMTQQKIAEALGITRSAVRDIKIGKSWAWL